MTNIDLERLEDSLRLHLCWLHRLMKDANRFSAKNYLPIAGQLRALLCDSDVPILLHYAKHKGIPLRIVAQPSSIGTLPELPSPILELNSGGFRPHWNSNNEEQTIDFSEFLDLKIGVVPVGGTGSAYSSRQVIKWVANKEGVSHLDFKRPATLESLNSISFHNGDVIEEAFVIQNLIYSLGRWTQIAIPYSLNIANLGHSLRERLSRDITSSIPDITKYQHIAHYNLLSQSIKMTYFEGEHGFETHSMKQELEAFGLHMFVSIPEEQLNSDKGCIFEIETKDNQIGISLWLLDNVFEARMQYGDKIIANCSITIPQMSQKDLYFPLSLQFDFSLSNIRIEFAIEGKVESSESKQIEEFPNQIICSDLYLGYNKEHNYMATFFATEVIFTSGFLSESDLGEIAHYLWMGPIPPRQGE